MDSEVVGLQFGEMVVSTFKGGVKGDVGLFRE